MTQSFPQLCSRSSRLCIVLDDDTNSLCSDTCLRPSTSSTSRAPKTGQCVVFTESKTQCDSACVEGLFAVQALLWGPAYKYKIASLRLEIFQPHHTQPKSRNSASSNSTTQIPNRTSHNSKQTQILTSPSKSLVSQWLSNFANNFYGPKTSNQSTRLRI